MIETKIKILEELHELLSSNVLGDKQYRNRYNGFMAELAFQDWFKLNRESNLIDGGMFIPTKVTDNPFNEAIYFTSSEFSPLDYVEIYTRASVLAPKGAFFIQYNISTDYLTWKRESLFQTLENGRILNKSFSVPPFEVFKFNLESKTFLKCSISDITSNFYQLRQHLNKKEIPEELKQRFITKFSQFDTKHLLKVYLERLFFDGYLNLTYLRGAPLDIDTFVYAKNGALCLLEIKEKDISKREPRGFGMDLRRINSLSKLSEVFKAESYYVVRHINNQVQRQFVDWRIISLKKFKDEIKNSPVVEGGTGMRSSSSSNPTKVCRFALFKQLM